jgi:SLOG cluster2/TIR domain
MRIFVSYRRDDSDALVTLLKETLERERRHSVFVDTQSLPPGIPFPQQLEQAIESAEVVIAVIGPGWVRADRTIEDDWCYRELLLARGLSQGDPWAKPIVPLLHGRAALPPSAELPEELAFLSELGRLEILTTRSVPDELAAFDARLRRLERELAQRAAPLRPLAGRLIGLSASPPLASELRSDAHSPETVSNFAVALADELLDAGADLAYAGLDPTNTAWSAKNNLTYHLARAARRMRFERPRRDRVINYLSPLHQRDALDMDDDCFALRLPVMEDLGVESTNEAVHEALGYTVMRRAAVADCSARLCVGGKASNYRGRLPGVLEEAWLALLVGQPLFLIGSFGGAAAILIDQIEGLAPAGLTLSGQIAAQIGQGDTYLEIVDELAGSLASVSYSTIRKSLAVGWPALGNGLAEAENRELAQCEDPTRATELVALGLSRTNTGPEEVR